MKEVLQNEILELVNLENKNISKPKQIKESNNIKSEHKIKHLRTKKNSSALKNYKPNKQVETLDFAFEEMYPKFIENNKIEWIKISRIVLRCYRSFNKKTRNIINLKNLELLKCIKTVIDTKDLSYIKTIKDFITLNFIPPNKTKERIKEVNNDTDFTNLSFDVKNNRIDQNGLLKPKFKNNLIIESPKNNPFLIQFKQLNWDIFPTGKTFDIVTSRAFLDKHILKYSKTEFERVENKTRFETILKHKPIFMAKGREGMQGYVVFGFEKSKLYICESVWTGNATYIFQNNWEEFTKLSRKQIRQRDLHTARITHTAYWDRELNRIVKMYR